MNPVAPVTNAPTGSVTPSPHEGRESSPSASCRHRSGVDGRAGASREVRRYHTRNDQVSQEDLSTGFCSRIAPSTARQNSSPGRGRREKSASRSEPEYDSVSWMEGVLATPADALGTSRKYLPRDSVSRLGGFRELRLMYESDYLIRSGWRRAGRGWVPEKTGSARTGVSAMPITPAISATSVKPRGVTERLADHGIPRGMFASHERCCACRP
jgi:hypothetical protein